MAGESDVRAEGTEDAFNFDEWANNIGLKSPATQTLRNEELTSKEMLILLEQKDMKELGLTMGTIKLIQKQIDQWKNVKDTEPVSTESVDPVVEDNTEILDGAGKTFDILFSDLLPPSGKEKSELFGQMDPRAILTLKSQTNKAVHITQFLTEKSKRWRQNKCKEFVLKAGTVNSETLVLKTDDEHPYLVIYMGEWGTANMCLLNHLLTTKKLWKEETELYLAYTTKIFQFAEKYEWNSVLNYNHTYRELQVEHQFQWGIFSPSMEIQLLVPKRSQQTQKPPQQTAVKVEDCRIFKTKGACPFGTSCRYCHPKAKPSTDNSSDPAGPKNM